MASRGLLLSSILSLIGLAAVAAEPALGSAEFRPTLERPFGWRGDGTGRYPGATPPVSWSRRGRSGATGEGLVPAPETHSTPKLRAKVELWTMKERPLSRTG